MAMTNARRARNTAAYHAELSRMSRIYSRPLHGNIGRVHTPGEILDGKIRASDHYFVTKNSAAPYRDSDAPRAKSEATNPGYFTCQKCGKPTTTNTSSMQVSPKGTRDNAHSESNGGSVQACQCSVNPPISDARVEKLLGISKTRKPGRKTE